MSQMNNLKKNDSKPYIIRVYELLKLIILKLLELTKIKTRGLNTELDRLKPYVVRRFHFR